MFLQNFSLLQFRNYKHGKITFKPSINIIMGENAIGKTNLLEAIYVLSLGKSFRTNHLAQLIFFGADYSRIEGDIISYQREKNLSLYFDNECKKAKINSITVAKTSTYMNHLNTVIFFPDDLSLIKASPRLRRKFLDLELCKISSKYMYYLRSFQELLKERNIYLKRLQQRKSLDTTYLSVLDEQLCSMQVEIIKRRYQFITTLEKELQSVYRALTLNKEKISLSYHCFVPIDSSVGDLVNLYQQNQKLDIQYGVTQKGVHKDDILISMNNRKAIYFSSQGQQRTIVLALKIALVEVIKEVIGEYPILLLDDVLSELDDYRKSMLLSVINKDIQTFITTTSLDGIAPSIIHNANHIDIASVLRG